MFNPKTMPWILVDMTRNRIRVPKHTLRSLGTPDFVRLLINPEARTMVLEVCGPDDSRRHRIPSYVMNSKQCYEINSIPFCEQLQEHTKWKNGSAYKLFASAQAGEQLLIFKLDEARLSASGVLIMEAGEKGDV